MSLPIGSIWRDSVRFSGTATSISAVAYLNGSNTSMPQTVSLVGTDTQGTPSQTVQEFAFSLAGRADGDDLKIVVMGTVSGETEKQYAYATCSTAVGSRAAPGAQMDLVAAPNATAITAIQSGLSKPGTAQTITPADTAAAATAQTSIATLLTRVPSTVHTATQQTADISTIGTWIGNVPGFVWAYNGVRSLTTFGALVADIVAGVWSAAVRKITGGTLDVTPPTAAEVATAVSNLPAWATWHTVTTQTADMSTAAGWHADTITALMTRASQASVNTIATTLGTLVTSTSSIGGSIEAVLMMTEGEGTQRRLTPRAVSNVAGGGGGGVTNFDDTEVTVE